MSPSPAGSIHRSSSDSREWAIRVDDADLFVVDWIAESRPRPNENSRFKPRLTSFTDMDELSSYIRRPSRRPIAARLIHMINIRDASRPLNEFTWHPIVDDFKPWAMRGARQKAVNLTCFASEPLYTWRPEPAEDLDPVAVDPYSPGSRHHRIAKIYCSFDYFGLCEASGGDSNPCLHDKHSFSISTPNSSISESERASSPGSCVACPRRFSVFVHAGPPEDFGEGEINPNDPACVILVSEDASHPCSAIYKDRLTFMIQGERIGSGMNITSNILHVLFQKVSVNWSSLVGKAVEHCRYLEDCVYARPDDESQAERLWTASKSWLIIERLLRTHIAVLDEFKHDFNKVEAYTIGGSKGLADFNAGNPEGTAPMIFFRCDDVQKTLRRCVVQVEDDLTKPTTNLLDMLYKSVAIRDAKLSLQLNASLWRLSWITFIFLPLTFLSGFFGMNVDLFAENPSIKWYFISAGVVVAFFFLLWLVIKLVQKRQVLSGRQKSHRNMV